MVRIPPVVPDIIIVVVVIVTVSAASRLSASIPQFQLAHNDGGGGCGGGSGGGSGGSGGGSGRKLYMGLLITVEP